MLKYTKASIDRLVTDCKKYARIFRYLSLIATVVLLAYQISINFINKKVLAYVYVGLAAFFLAFTVIDFIFEFKKQKIARRIAKRIYTWTKIAVKAGILGFLIYEIAVTDKLNGIQIILTTLMIVLWAASILAQLISQVVSSRAEELLIAIKQDFDDIKRPVTTVSNVFKKITGQEVKKEEDDPIKTKILNRLRDHIDKKKNS